MEVMWGMLCGVCCVIPGWGIGLSLVLALLGPEGSGVYAIVSGLIFNSIVEAKSPIFSGSLYTGVFSYRLKLNPNDLFSLIVKYKAIAWIMGVVAGLLLPPLLGVKGLLVTWIFVIYLLMKQGEKWYLGAMWILGVRYLVKICSIAGLEQPIVIVSIVLFILPAVFRGEECEVDEIDFIGEPNWLVVWWSSLLSLLAPGVSPAAVTTTLEGRSGFVSSYLSTLVVEVVIEAIALGQSVKGESLGKALISSVAIVPSLGVIVLSISVMLVAAGLVILIKPYLNYDVDLRYPTGVVATIALVVMSGLWVFLLVPAGYLISLIGNKLDSSGKGLTFVGLLA